MIGLASLQVSPHRVPLSSSVGALAYSGGMPDLNPSQFSPAMMPRRKVDHTPDTYSLTPHAAQQATSKGWSHEEVLAAANDPHTTYDNGRYPGQKRHIRGNLVAVVHPASMTVKTVYQNVKETNVRADQTDADARRYAARRARS